MHHRLSRAQGTGSGPGSQPHPVSSMRLAVAVCALVACVHAGLWALNRERSAAPDIQGPLPAFPTRHLRICPIRIASAQPPSRSAPDLKIIAPHTRAIRTYSFDRGVELVPAIADEFGLKVTVGAWIDKDEAQRARDPLGSRSRQEEPQRQWRGGRQRDDLPWRPLRRRDHQAHSTRKREVQVPVTTGEIWHAWIDHPELATAVDFIAAHILPYWEGISDKAAVDQAIGL